jgi:hypothetical protein
MIRLVIHDQASAPDDYTSFSVPIFIDQGAALTQVKLQATSLFPLIAQQNLVNASGGRLKTLDGKVMVREKNTVSSLNLKDGQSLILEAAALPADNQIHLRFQLVKNSVVCFHNCSLFLMFCSRWKKPFMIWLQICH